MAIIRLRRDTAVNWTNQNPVLALGEPGVETDTNKMKIGDGATAWTGLAYTAGGGQSNRIDNGMSTVIIPTENGPALVNVNDDKEWQFLADGSLMFPDGTVQTTAYTTTDSGQLGYFVTMQSVDNNNSEWDGEAVLADGEGNTYVSYSYYNNNTGNMVGGIAKFDSTGTKLWAKNYQAIGNYQYPRISSLEYFGLAPFITAIGYHYNNDSGFDEGFMFLINPDGSSVNGYDTSFTAGAGMMVEDGVFYNENGPASVVVGQTYNENALYTLTPIAPSTTDRLYVTWSDLTASGLLKGQSPRYINNGTYWMNNNILEYQVVASVNGTGTQEWPYMYVTVTYNEAGVYSVTSIGGGSGYDQWNNQTLKILGSNLGGVDGVNDLTFNFDWSTFNGAGQPYQNPIGAGISNVQGTSISDVYMSMNNSFDFSTVIGTPQTNMFNLYLNNQAAVVKLGGTSSWTINVGGSNYEELHSVAVDQNTGDVYAVGTYYDNATNKAGAVFKFNIAGNLQWSKYVDSDSNTNIELRTVDLTTYGEGQTAAFVMGDDRSVTKLDSNGDILWQVYTGDVSLNADPRGCVTPEGDYIVLFNEDNNYHLYVTRLSGVDGSVIWQKDISYHQGYNWNGELYVYDDFDATNIDCDATTISIAGTSYYYDGNNGVYRGYVIRIPSDGAGNGQYDEFTVSDLSIEWTTRSTTSASFTPQFQTSTVQTTSITMDNNSDNSSATVTPLGGTAPAVAGIERHSASAGNDTVTLATEHNGKFLYYNGGNGNSTIRTPSNANSPLPIGFTTTFVVGNFDGNRVYVNSDGNGDVTIYAAGQDIFNTNWWYCAGNGNAGVYTIMKIDTDTWMLAGPAITWDD